MQWRSDSSFGVAIRVAATLAIALTAFVGCSSDDSTTDSSDPGNSSRGAELYAQSCASCHGADLTGTDKGPSHLSQVYAADHHSDESFRAAILQGTRAHHWDFGDMDPVPGLDDAEIDAIIAYVRAQQDARGLEPYPPE